MEIAVLGGGHGCYAAAADAAEAEAADVAGAAEADAAIAGDAEEAAEVGAVVVSIAGEGDIPGAS